MAAQQQVARHTDRPEAAHRATRMVVGVLGTLVGAAGIEHGVGEVLQGPVRPDGVLIMSWPDAVALEVLSGEPAMTLIPDLRVTGVVAIVVGTALVVWSIGVTDRRLGGSVLIGLSVLLLLTGGGLAPPLMGMVLGVVTARIGVKPHRRPGPLPRRVAPAWPWFLATALVGYLGLMPGMLLAHAWGVASEILVVVLGTVAFTGFGLALSAARAHDRLRTSPSTHRPAQTISPPDDRPSGATIRAVRILTGAVVILLGASSLAGLLIDGLYQDPDAVVAMLRGCDLAALVAAVPLLAVTLAPSLRSSVRARLVATGALAFVVYDYAYYVFGTTFNDLFLVHVATFSTATFALILVLSAPDVTTMAGQFRARTPARTVAVVLGVLAGSLAAMWISESLGFAVSGMVPDDGNALVSPIELTHLGYAMDLAFLAPAYGLGAVLLWRRRPWGYVLGAAMLVAGALTQLTYMAALVFQSRADVPGASVFDPFAPVILIAYLVGAGLLLANLRPDDAPAKRPGRLLRLVFRAPLWLYRARLGWVLGNRFLRLTHRGRRSGRVHQTVLEVVRFDPTLPEWTVVSGYGDTSDWLRNLQAAPAVSIEVGRRRFVPQQRFLDEHERRELLAGYQREHPRAARQLGRRLLGATFDAAETSIDALARRLPAVAFRTSPAPPSTGAITRAGKPRLARRTERGVRASRHAFDHRE